MLRPKALQNNEKVGLEPEPDPPLHTDKEGGGGRNQFPAINPKMGKKNIGELSIHINSGELKTDLRQGCQMVQCQTEPSNFGTLYQEKSGNPDLRRLFCGRKKRAA
jgi:hypothetical protein